MLVPLRQVLLKNRNLTAMLLLKHGRVWVRCELKPSGHPYTSKPVFLGWSHAGAD